jgi:hypothetical protein
MKRVTLLSPAGNLEIQPVGQPLEFWARADLTAASYLMWKGPERKSIEVPNLSQPHRANARRPGGFAYGRG